MKKKNAIYLLRISIMNNLLILSGIQYNVKLKRSSLYSSQVAHPDLIPVSLA